MLRTSCRMQESEVDNEEIIDKMIKMNMLKPIEDDYIVDKNRINNYIEEG